MTPFAPDSLTRRLFEVVSSGAPEDLVVARATEIGLAPLVRRLLDRPRSDRTYRIALAVQKRALRQILTRFEEEALGALVFKGLPLAQLLFDDPAARHSSDLDLLVAADDVPRARAVLEKMDYAAAPGHERPSFADNKEMELWHRQSDLIVDLHWRVALPWVPAPASSVWAAHSVLVDVEGVGPVPTLRADDTFLQLCYHFHGHAGFLKGLFDIAACLDRFGHEIAPDALRARAQQLGIWGLVQWPICTLSLLIGAPVPLLDETMPAGARWLAGRSASAFRGALARSEPIADREAVGIKLHGLTRGRQMGWAALSMLALDRRSDRMRAVLAPIFLGPSRLAEKEGKPRPDAATWIHMGLRPAILVGKQARDLWAQRRDRPVTDAQSGRSRSK